MPLAGSRFSSDSAPGVRFGCGSDKEGVSVKSVEAANYAEHFRAVLDASKTCLQRYRATRLGCEEI